MDLTPIYVCGCDRSGTTMLGSIIGEHSHCFTIPETQFFIDTLGTFRKHQVYNSSKILEQIKRHWRFRLWNLHLLKTQNVSLSKIDSPSALLVALISIYQDTHSKTTATYWVDHTPANIQYLSTFFSFFPTAKAIHLIRDGRAVASSVIPLDWGPIDAKGAATWWMNKIAHGLAAELAFPNRVCRVRYEDVLNEPRFQLERIQNFIQVPIENLLETEPQYKVPKYTRKQHLLVGTSLDSKRSEAWRLELSTRDIETFEYLTGELLTYLGYPLSYGLSATPPPKETLFDAIKNYFSMESQKQRRKRRIFNTIQHGK